MMSKGCLTAIIAMLLALGPSLAGAQTPPPLPAPTPPPLPQPPAAEYYYNDSGKPAGPVTLAEIQAKIADGTIKPDTLVWKAGAPSWVAAKDQPEIAPLFAGGPTPGPAPSADSGCNGKVLLSDDFKEADSSWGASPEKVSVEEHKVKVKTDPNGHTGFAYSGQNFGDADYCVTVQSPNNLKDVNDSNLLAGLLFWAAHDEPSAYSVFVQPNGAVAVGRALKGNWTTPVPFRLFGAFKKGAGAKNMLRVSTSANSIIVFINGLKFASLRAQEPEGGGEIGFWAQSEKSSRDTWKFFNLKVTEHAQ